MSNARPVVLVAIGAVIVALVVLVVLVAQPRLGRTPGIEAPAAPPAVAGQAREPLALASEAARDAITFLTESERQAAPCTPESSAPDETDRVTLPVGVGSSQEHPSSDGWHVTHHANGALHSEGEFRDGRREGLWRDYSEKGVLQLEGVYERGEATGVWRAWYENAAIRGVARCERGQFHGVCRFWTPEGEPDLQRTGRYVNGERVE